MRFGLGSIALMLMVSTQVLYAQRTDRQDCIIMKDSTQYHGKIVEFDLFDYVSMRRDNGKWIRVSMTDVARIIRQEVKLPRESQAIDTFIQSKKFAPIRYNAYEPEPKGYFFQLRFNMEYAQFGIHAVNGYRFSNWHQLGFGVGYDNSVTSVSFIPSRHNGRQHQIGGMYVPLYLHYGGDKFIQNTILFYHAELGYAFNPLHYTNNWSSPLGLGGVHAATVIGVGFRTHKIYNFRIGFRVSIRPTEFRFREYTMDVDKGILQLNDTERTVTSLFLGISFIHYFGR
jgi:hypothetical protein